MIDKATALTASAPQILSVPGATRTPYFCSGCPHNTSTKLPEGSMAASGIGCHVMASWMNRETVGFAQMGGEGVPIAVAQMYNRGKHMFQNIGEGTWYHSGSLAVRQAVAADANISFKILFNDAVAMTGGQPVDGPISVEGIAQSCRAEGVQRIAVVSDDPSGLSRAEFPIGITVHDRAELDTVQRELRDIPGVTVLIYVQTCATEKRRRRKRGEAPDPKRFVMINPLVCEGCGDCSMESNCLSVEPLETPFGRKRKINLSTCNKDFSCLNGFCPSFVTIEGGSRRGPRSDFLDLTKELQNLPQPVLPNLGKPFDLLVTGVGGTGVVTVGALITMAAHLERKGVSVLDFTGFAQKFGTVLSYIRIGTTPADIFQPRIDQRSADAVIGCDIVVSSAPKASMHYSEKTRMVLNSSEMPTGDLVLNRDASLRTNEREAMIRQSVAEVSTVDANGIAEAQLGDSVFANMIMLGMAWQKGLIPIGLPAIRSAIRLNGVAIERNFHAFDLGRVLAETPVLLAEVPKPDPSDESAAIDLRADFVAAYQNRAYAKRYLATLDQFAQRLSASVREDLVPIAANALFKLMTYKDEYEVARLHCDPTFLDAIHDGFEGDYRVHYHMAPPFLAWRKDARGRPKKRAFGPWMASAMKVLARLRWVRGTLLDPFGYTAERREERALIAWYEDLLERLPALLTDENQPIVKQILSAPLDMRGYGAVKAEAVARKKADVAAKLSQLDG